MNTDPLSEFQKRANTSNKSDWVKAVLGSDSCLCQLLRSFDVDDETRSPNAVSTSPMPAFESAATHLATFGESEQKIRSLWHAVDDDQNSDVAAAHARATMRGLVHALRAAGNLKTGNGALQEDLQKALKSFSDAWGKGYLCDEKKAASWSFSQTDPVQRELHLFSDRTNPVAFWVVHDLLDRWVFRDGRTTTAPLSATTPILGAITGRGKGNVLYLTVELFPCENGSFCPDPLNLGLTNVTVCPTEESITLLESMRKVWNASGLSPRFRGRWRIEISGKHRPTGHLENQDLFPPRYGGRSAEAATLCAMLAASGTPYGADNEGNSGQQKIRPHRAEPLAAGVAISATVKYNELSAVKKPQDLPLGSVGKVPEKLASAALVLSEVLLTDGELKNLQGEPDDIETVAKIQEEQNRRRDPKKPYTGLLIYDVSKVMDALDLMLQTNRYLRDYQAEVRNEWLRDWQQGTARFQGNEKIAKDDAPGHDDDNVRDEVPSADNN